MKFTVKDRFDGDRDDFKKLIESWDKLRFAGHAPQMVPLEIMGAAREALKDSPVSLMDVRFMEQATECVNVLAPLPRNPDTLGQFKECLTKIAR